MLAGIERLVDLSGGRQSALTGATAEQVLEAVRTADTGTLAATDGHFAAVGREGQTVRLARTIGVPLRYFVAKMFHGPILIVAERMDQIHAWLAERGLAWQFEPAYTRMIPAHYLVELDQVGCPDPAPRYRRFFNPAIANGSSDIAAAGRAYAEAARDALVRWMRTLPPEEPIAVAF